MKVVIIGAGNVGSHLAHGFIKSGIEIPMIMGRSEKRARSLSEDLDIPFTLDINSLPSDADIYLLCVSDHAIHDLISELEHLNGLIAHTSGTTGLNCLKKNSRACGVFYPLQTFTAGKDLELSKIPYCIEADSDENFLKLKTLASALQGKSYNVDSEQRKLLHLCAVMSSNFSNHLMRFSQELLEKKNLSPELLKPLMEETVEKAFFMGPEKAQTGPAKRGDEHILHEHLRLLEKEPSIKEVYKVMSKSIMQDAKANGKL